MALVCDLSIPSTKFLPADPCGRRFRFGLATQLQLKEAGFAVSLYLWWAHAASFPPDNAIRLSWDAMRAILPTSPARLRLRLSEALAAESELTNRHFVKWFKANTLSLFYCPLLSKPAVESAYSLHQCHALTKVYTTNDRVCTS